MKISRYRPIVFIAMLCFVVGCGSEGERREAGASDAGGRRDSVVVALDGGEAAVDADGAGFSDEASLGPRPDRLDAAALERVRVGDERAALAAVEGLSKAARARGEIRYLRARLLERLKRYGEAADSLSFDLDELPASVAREAKTRRATLLAKADRCAEAQEVIEALGGAPGVGAARAALASCELRAGEAASAEKALSGLLARKTVGIDEWRVRRQLAEAQARVKKQAEAIATLRELVLEMPEHREAAEVEARLRELGAKLEWTYAERLRRARRLLARRRYKAASEELPPETRPEKWAQRATWLHLRGMALYKTRHNYAEAAKLLAEAARHRGSTAIDDEFHAARALSRADLDDQAIEAYRRLVKAHPRHARAAEAEYLAAWLEVHHERPAGEVNMAAFIDGPRARRAPELKLEATWHLAFRAFEKGQYAKAAQLFNRYAKGGSGGLDKGRGFYWQGRALEKMGRKNRAAQAYRLALNIETLHWYALWARQRLEGMGEEVGPPLKQGPTAKAPPRLPAPALPDDVRFYASLGLEEDAIDRARAQENALRAAAPRGREQETLIAIYHQIGAYRRAYRLAWREREELRWVPSSRNRWVWDALYPRPYRSLVERQTKRRGVEPAHVWATMRQESGYAPRVVSHANAIGLLQMLPSTARSMSKRLGVKSFERRMLFDPAWNIRFGVAEIADVVEEFEGNLPLAIAAYNAGSARVHRWLSKLGETELDRFVERIPFNETRNYVRRVTTHYARYRYLESPSAGWPIRLPEKVGPIKSRTPSKNQEKSGE